MWGAQSASSGGQLPTLLTHFLRPWIGLNFGGWLSGSGRRLKGLGLEQDTK